jgi:hypothetical protein
MKRKIAIKTALVLSLLTFMLQFNVQTNYAEQQSSNPISVLLNGEKLSFDVDPYIKEGRTLVPFRAILEALGAEVIWNPTERSVTAKSESREIYLKIGDTVTTVNGSEVIIDVPAEITNSRTFVPLRFVSENLGATVLWDGTTRTVSIEYKYTSIVEPGDEEIPASSGAIGTFDNGDIKIIINKVKFDSEKCKFHIYGKANFNDKSVILRVYDSQGNLKVADFVSIGSEQGMKSFEALINTRTADYNPESIIISVQNKEKNGMDMIGKIDL